MAPSAPRADTAATGLLHANFLRTKTHRRPSIAQCAAAGRRGQRERETTHRFGRMCGITSAPPCAWCRRDGAIHHPHSIVVFALTLQNAHLLQSRKIALNGTLAHRQNFRHLFTCHCRRLFNKIDDFPLAFSGFRLRHVSVMVSDIGNVGGGKNDGLELGRR